VEEKAKQQAKALRLHLHQDLLFHQQALLVLEEEGEEGAAALQAEGLRV